MVRSLLVMPYRVSDIRETIVKHRADEDDGARKHRSNEDHKAP